MLLVVKICFSYIFICHQTMSTSSSSTNPPEHLPEHPPELWELIVDHFDHSLSLVYPELNETCRFADIKGEALEKYGDDYIWYLVIYNFPSLVYLHVI